MNATIRSALCVAVLGLATPRAASAAGPAKDVVDTAVEAGSFKTLVAAVQAADLVATLKGPGPYTVFAPTDEAFAKIPKADLDALLKDKAKLAAVLKNHVLPMKATMDDLVGLKSISSAQGGKLTFEAVKGGGFKVNGATVVKPNIDVSNGMVHAIDAVIPLK
ncbi:MAG TPA: fasciclin domain-containing protein [Anaeromyxobacteraceae bacterium]|nr:fasciclin domain-containing protein [Anaeromyxobacteraceae bacterium]